MSPRIIKPKYNHHLPSFILPDYNNVKESFAPFLRLEEPNDLYETLKMIFCGVFLFPIRAILTLIFLFILTSFAMIGSIGYDPIDLEHLTHTLPMWRRICFNIVHFSGCAGLFVFGFHNISIKRYSYKDMEQLFNYRPPITISLDANGDEIHPLCHIIASNHIGFSDILFLAYYFNGAFVAKGAIKNVIAVGKIAIAMRSLFIQNGQSTSKVLLERVTFDHDYHSRTECRGCSLCLSNVVIFPEGTTTNGNDMIMFRRGIFNSGLPIRPIVIKCPWRSVNPTWETIPFANISWKLMTQFSNNIEVYVAPPYVPTEDEQQDSVLYAYNMNILMAQMIGLNNENRKANIYLTNRDVKVNCFHQKYLSKLSDDAVLKEAKQRIQNETLIERYLSMIRNDDRYEYGEETDDEDEQSETSVELK